MALTKAKMEELIASGDIEVGISNPMPDDTLIVNLNADKLDGNHASDFIGSGMNIRPERIAVTTTSPGVTVTESTLFIESGTKSWRVELQGIGAQYIRMTPGMAFVAGQTYSFSCVVRDGTSITNVVYLDQNGGTVETAYTNDVYLSRNSGNHTKVVATFTPLVSGTPTHGLLIYFGGDIVSTSIYLSAIKLERGAIATSWSPAGDDVAFLAYPVGAIYMSAVSTSPATLFGGTWASIATPPSGAGYWWKRTA